MRFSFSQLTRKPRRIYALLVFGLFFIGYILPLGAAELFVVDETRYAEIPREMIASGDWVVPHFNGLRYFEKPPLGYWMNAASMVLFGENAFAVRLPSALAAGLTALTVFLLMGRVLSREPGGWSEASVLGALIFLSCFEVFGVGNSAVLDTPFSFFLTVTTASFYLATEEPRGSWKERGFLFLSGLGCGLSFLTKGFLAFAVPALALASYLIWERRFRDLFRMSLIPVFTALLVASPWGIFIHLREPDFWRFFFWNEHVRRFLADSAQHKESFWYFFIIAPAAFLPWTFLIPAAAPGIKRFLNVQGPAERMLRFSLCWFLLPFLFFSVSNGKLLTYILPCFPPFAVLIALGLSHEPLGKKQNRLLRWGLMGNAGVFGALLAALAAVQLFGYGGIRPFDHMWKTIMAVNGFVFFIVFCLAALESRGGPKKTVFTGVAPLLLFFLAHFIVPGPTCESRIPGLLLKKHLSEISQNDIVISDEDTIGAVCWYLNRSDVFILGSPGELDYGLNYADAEGRRLTRRSLSDLVNAHQGKIVVIARKHNQTAWEDWLPKPVYQDVNGPSGYVYLRY